MNISNKRRYFTMAVMAAVKAISRTAAKKLASDFSSKEISHAKEYLKKHGFDVDMNAGKMARTISFDPSSPLSRAQQAQEALARFSTFKFKNTKSRFSVPYRASGDTSVEVLRAIRAQGELKKSRTYAVKKGQPALRRRDGKTVGLVDDISQIFISREQALGPGGKGTEAVLREALQNIQQNRSEMDYIHYKADAYKKNVLMNMDIPGAPDSVNELIGDKIDKMSDIDVHNLTVDIGEGKIRSIKRGDDFYTGSHGDGMEKTKDLIRYLDIDVTSIPEDTKRDMILQFGLDIRNMTDANGNVDWSILYRELQS